MSYLFKEEKKWRNIRNVKISYLYKEATKVKNVKISYLFKEIKPQNIVPLKVRKKSKDIVPLSSEDIVFLEISIKQVKIFFFFKQLMILYLFKHRPNAQEYRTSSNNERSKDIVPLTRRRKQVKIPYLFIHEGNE